MIARMKAFVIEILLEPHLKSILKRFFLFAVLQITLFFEKLFPLTRLFCYKYKFKSYIFFITCADRVKIYQQGLFST